MLTPENTFNRDEVRGKMRFFAGAPQIILFFLPRTAKAQQRVQIYVPTPTEPAQTVSGCVGACEGVKRKNAAEKLSPT